MSRNQEFTDALESARDPFLEKARASVMAHLARHDPEGQAHPARIAAAIQGQAEQLRGRSKLRASDIK